MKILVTTTVLAVLANGVWAGNSSFPSAPNKSSHSKKMKSVSGATGAYVVALPATAVSKLDNGDTFSLYGFVFTKLNGEARFAFENAQLGVVCKGQVAKSGASSSTCSQNGKVMTKSSSTVNSGGGKKSGANISSIKDPSGKVIGKSIVSWALKSFPDAKPLLAKLN